ELVAVGGGVVDGPGPVLGFAEVAAVAVDGLTQCREAGVVVARLVGPVDCGQHPPQVDVDDVRVDAVPAAGAVVEDELAAAFDAGGLAQQAAYGVEVGTDPVDAGFGVRVGVDNGGHLLEAAASGVRGEDGEYGAGAAAADADRPG